MFFNSATKNQQFFKKYFKTSKFLYKKTTLNVAEILQD
ncbi:hypothetical protein X279_04320 [Oenococcus oeni IOEB_0501]|nr:hypothetical protein X279_04320 [Oenococcus oeni IOEB_0501]